MDVPERGKYGAQGGGTDVPLPGVGQGAEPAAQKAQRAPQAT